MKKFPKTRLRQLMKSIVKIIQNEFQDNWNKFDKNIHTVMEELGFENIGYSTSDKVFMHEEDGYIFKVPYLCGDDGFVPHRAIPTVVDFIEFKTKSGSFKEPFFIQPIADTSSKAFEKIEKRLDDDMDVETWGEDPHYGNLGLYNNRIVVFDW